MKKGQFKKTIFGITFILFMMLIYRSILATPANAAQPDGKIAELRSSMRGPTGAAVQLVKGESARISLKDGYVRTLGAPANHYFPVSKAAAGNPTLTAKNFIAERGEAFGVKSKAVDFVPKKSKSRGIRRYERLQQTYCQIPVFGAEMVIQLNVSGGVEYAVSDIMRETSALDDGKVLTVPSISAADAEFLAIELMTKEYAGLQLDSSDAKLMIYHPAVVGNSGATRLVWRTVVISVSVPTVNELVLIDAHTGDTALHYTQIMNAKNRKVYDSANTDADPGTLKRSEGDSATGIADVDDCYDFLGDTYDFYFNEHGRDGIDNAGMILSATVLFCPDYPLCPYENAFWNGSRMYFGEGYVVDDVTAHELTHGVTQYESDLVYYNESGAINESFSDMWGEWVDLTNGAGNDVPSVRWLMGEEIPDGAIRNMADPTEFGDPDRKNSPNWYTGSGDNGGVHINSGVGNKLCYLLTDGDTFNGRTITGMGISAVADLFYEAQTNILTSGSDYADLHDALTQAAINLGWSSDNRINLEKACLATEISNLPAGVVVLVDGKSIDMYDMVYVGSAYKGTAGPSKTFTILNNLEDTLTLDKPFASTAHFTVSSPAADELAFGEETTFTVTLNTVDAGNFDEEVSFGNSSPDQNPYIFNVTGTVTNMKITKFTAAAGKTAGSDSFDISGSFTATAGEIADANKITVDITSLTDGYTVYTQNIHFNPVNVAGGKYSHKGGNGAITSLKFDLIKHTFSIQAKKVDLTGLSCPLMLRIVIGDYTGIGNADETIVNGKSLIPLSFMTGHADTLRLSGISWNYSKWTEIAPWDSIKANGTLAIETEPNDIGTVTIKFGDQSFSVTPSKLYNRYECYNVGSSGGGSCSMWFWPSSRYWNYKIIFYKLELLPLSDDAEFGMTAFGDFEASIPLPQ